MSYVSPFLNPAQYVTKLNGLSSEGITIDEGVDRAIRDAKEFSDKYSTDFALVAQLKTKLDPFKSVGGI